jgi:predicted lipoprotein with Yx(FWY)xxD motif
MMRYARKPILAIAALSLLAVGLAACGGGSSSTTVSSMNSSATTSSAGGSATVSTMSVAGVGTALVDSKGDVLYTNNRDSASKVACTGECTAIWVPATAPSSGKPTSDDSAVQSKLGTVKSPDGGTIVTFSGKPLYTFVQDSPGKATGNGFMDSFNGTSFTWTVATPSGSAPASSTGGGSSTSSGSTGASSGATSGGSSGGGYGY